MHTYRTRRRIEFADTDMGGIVHFSRFFVFMESAEHELLASLGTAVHTRWQGRAIGWPRLAASCEYKSPARFGDELEIEVQVERKGRTSMTYRFTFRCGERLVAQGRMSSACCVLDDPSGLVPISIPPFIADHLEEAPGGGK
ncbi:MAG TPA: thioesterase family protein [Thermoanaerobaculia bacterium]|nr:thioesterase family protein [Thermoanaerobaculia bacterium]